MKMRPVGTELFRGVGQTDRHMNKLTVYIVITNLMH